MLWIRIFYVLPMFFSALYFTLIKIDDMINNKEIFSNDKFSYLQTILICVVPLVNIFILILIIKHQFAKK